jgi:hypothetical protein
MYSVAPVVAVGDCVNAAWRYGLNGLRNCNGSNHRSASTHLWFKSQKTMQPLSECEASHPIEVTWD